MEEKTTKESARKKAELLLHHLKPAASAFALGIGASLAATLLRTLFTQIIRFTVDHALMGDRAGLPGFLMDTTAGQLLVWCAAGICRRICAGFQPAKRLRAICQIPARCTVWAHPEAAVQLACAECDRRYHSAVYIRRGGCAHVYRRAGG